MECLACKAITPDHARFCNECGAPMRVLCTACGATSSPAAKFCSECGSKLSANRPAPSPPVTSTAPASSAERRQLSVVFCDLVGSTELSSQLDPEDLGELIRTYQDRVAETIGRFNGFIARFLGDGVLAYFGWPKADEADAEQAVRAALAAAEIVSAKQIRGKALCVRIGIATGLVVVGDRITTGEAQEQTAIGETPNRASRLQALAAPGGIVIDGATRRQVGDLFEVRALGALALKGLPKPVQAFEVRAELAGRSRFEALHGARLIPLVGREEELELLLRRWAQAQGGQGRVVLVPHVIDSE